MSRPQHDRSGEPRGEGAISGTRSREFAEWEQSRPRERYQSLGFEVEGQYTCRRHHGSRITDSLRVVDQSDSSLIEVCRHRAGQRSSKRQRDGRPLIVAPCAPTMGAKGDAGALLVLECCSTADQSTMESCC